MSAANSSTASTGTDSAKQTPEQQKQEEQKPAATTLGAEGASPAEKNLFDRIMGVMEDVLKAKLTEFEKKLDGKIDTILKTKELEFEHALRKGFGLENDPVVHMSDLIAHVRKASLEKAEPEKRTPGKEEAGPDGDQKVSGIEKMFDKASKGEV